MTVGLTPLQAKAHRFIFEYTRHKGRAPALKDIMESCGIGSPSEAYRLVGCLEERGKIKRVPHQTRGITLLETPPLPHTAYFKWNPETQALDRLEGMKA